MKRKAETVFLPPREAARRCGVSTGTIYRWISEGRIPKAIRTLGNHGRIPEEAIDALLGEEGNKKTKGTQENAKPIPKQ